MKLIPLKKLVVGLLVLGLGGCSSSSGTDTPPPLEGGLQLTLKSSGSGAGTLRVNDGTLCFEGGARECVITLDNASFQTLFLKPSADAVSRFEGISEAICDGAGSFCTLSVPTQNKSFNVTFNKKTITLTVERELTLGAHARISLGEQLCDQARCEIPVNAESKVPVTILPDEESTLLSVKQNGTALSCPGGVCVIEIGTAPVTLHATVLSKAGCSADRWCHMNLPAISAIKSAGTQILAAGANGLLMRSGDGGKNWGVMTVGKAQNFTDLYVSADSQLVVGVSGKDVWVSTNGGKDLKKVTVINQGNPNNLTAIYGAPSGNPLFVVGQGGTVATSTDLGETWSLFPNIGSTKTFTKIGGVVTDNNGLSLVITSFNGEFLTSTDGGVTWSLFASRFTGPCMNRQCNSPTNAGLYGVFGVKDPVDGTKSKWVIVGADGTVLFSNDILNSWEVRPTPTDGTLGAVTGNADMSRLFAVGNDSRFFVSSDLGQSFTLQTLPIEHQDLNSISILPNRVFVAGKGIIADSSDDGVTWRTFGNGIGEDLMHIKGGNGDKALFVTGTYRTFINYRGDTVQTTGLLASSADGGQTFQIRNSNVQATLFKVYSDPNSDTMFALSDRSQDSVISRSDNGGATWKSVDFSESLASRLVALNILTDTTVVSAVTFKGRFYNSYNLGNTWDIASPSNVNGFLATMSDGKSRQASAVTNMFASPNGRVIHVISASEGIFRSIDAGKTWLLSPNSSLVDLTQTLDGKYLMAVGGRTVIVSESFGSTWRSLLNGIPSDDIPPACQMKAPWLSNDHKDAYAVYFSSKHEMKILHSTNFGDWVAEETPASLDLSSIYGTADGAVYAVGAAGTLIKKF